jgi:mannose-1-phosphate guanylyltransferase
MIAVIIAGGAGTRLWPLSTNEYPKHLLTITDENSLLQNTYKRASVLADTIYVISDESHAHHIQKQLPDIPKENILVEPGRRGTASCIVMALAKIKVSHDDGEPIVFMHSDHQIRDTGGFIETLLMAADVSSQMQRIVILGLEPTHPATCYGYIERGDNANGGRVYDVVRFKEKPDHATAQGFLEKGNFLWNMGYFVAPLRVFEEKIQKKAPHLWVNYQKLLKAEDHEEHKKHYLGFENEPIDTAFIENVDDLLVVPGVFDWMDVGSYMDMHQVTPQDDTGNTVMGDVVTEHVNNSYLRNETDLPVAVVGVDNVAVVVTKNGVLVVNKSHDQKVGTVAKKIQGRKKGK